MTTDTLVSPFAGVFASFIGRRSGFTDSRRENLEHICSTLIDSMQAGHTCIGLTADQEELLLGCPLVTTTGASAPLVLVSGRLYLNRYYRYEKRLAEKITGLAGVCYSIENLDGLLNHCFLPSAEVLNEQREAARVALSKGLCLISGGPGTGKTTTVVKIIALLMAQYGPGFRMALTAPTGKAAMRLQQSVASQIPLLTIDDRIKNELPREAQTVHRLLGVRKHSHSFRHHAHRPLPWDVVIVDEASMVDLALMSKLVDALADGSRLILLGDKDQLASVESGAVLSDCIDVLSENVVQLHTAHRFNEEIAALAGHINRGNGSAAVQMLEDGNFSSVAGAGPNWFAACVDRYEKYLVSVEDFSSPDSLPFLFQSLNSFRILCALKNGSLGVGGVNERIERSLAARGFECGRAEWYPGRPVIITRNDYSLGLYNGDIGICLPGSPGSRERFVWFERQGGTFQRFIPVRLPSHQTAWALTVHKSQGSEFKEVMVILPENDNQVLSRELLYTAITRAKEKVTIRAESSLCRQVIDRVINRQSGLAEQLEFQYQNRGDKA